MQEMETAAPSERGSHGKEQDDKSILAILKMTVEELLILDLNDKFDMVLGMPWLARHDLVIDGEKRTVYKKMELEDPPTDTSELTSLPVMSWKRFAKNLGKMEQKRFDEQRCKILRELKDGLSDETPTDLPQDARLQHGIDLVPRKKYPDTTVATVAETSKVRDALLGFGARLRTELLLRGIRSQPGCGREEETRTKTGTSWPHLTAAAKLGLAAASILAAVVQDRSLSRIHPISRSDAR
ncbi:reverse transcriptase [Phytophthora megakarya]|uniref:Reverse transcriptase n=1 Tax=Phytophthora megakarya TaxID=4795 RepID=A0A225WM64_9STRA|nr:reverse transcriptase [Phytophthora megakarya]